MATVKVELLRRTPFGKAGDVVEVEESSLESYGPDVMEKTKKPLTSEVLAKSEKSAEKSEMNTDRVNELDAREKVLADKEEAGKEAEVQTGAVTGAKNTAVKTPEGK